MQRSDDRLQPVSDPEAALEVECHEAAMWTRCVEAAAAVDGNPLGAVIDHSTGVPLTAMTAVDSDEFNRVVALGVAVPTTRQTVDSITAFYGGLSQSRFRVEVAPVARPAELSCWLQDAGLVRTPVSVTKLWEPLTDSTPAVDDPGGFDVRRLEVADRNAVGMLHALGYGAWDSSVPLEPWSAAPWVGRASPTTAPSSTTS